MAWTDTVFKMVPLLRRNTITPSIENGATSEFQCDAQGRLLVNTQSPNTIWADGGSSAATKTVKGTSGRLYQIFGRNVGVSAAYIFIFDATTKPADGSLAEMFVPVKLEAGAAFSIDLPRPRAFSNGLTWVASSTDESLTYASGATFVVAAEYE